MSKPQWEAPPFSVWEHDSRMTWVAGGFKTRDAAIDAVRRGEVEIKAQAWSVHSCERINRQRECPEACSCRQEDAA